eukprot:294458-Chlamydomonas_euryale.AAC.1
MSRPSIRPSIHPHVATQAAKAQRTRRQPALGVCLRGPSFAPARSIPCFWEGEGRGTHSYENCGLQYTCL